MPRIAHSPPPPPADCLWIEDAADYIGVAKATLYKYRQLKKEPHGFEVGRKIAYEIAKLDAYLDVRKSLGAEKSAEDEAEMRPPEPRAAHGRRTPTPAAS